MKSDMKDDLSSESGDRLSVEHTEDDNYHSHKDELKNGPSNFEDNFDYHYDTKQTRL